jgi:hypothetical protein
MPRDTAEPLCSLRIEHLVLSAWYSALPANDRNASHFLAFGSCNGISVVGQQIKTARASGMVSSAM